MTAPAFKTAPIIETQRTILRAHGLDDFDTYAEMWSEPAVCRFIGGRARTREESWQRFLRHAGLWSLIGYGYWAVEEKATGRFIGEAGFQDMKREIQPSLEGLPEIGWVLASAAHGKGIASEIVGEMTAWADNVLGAQRTVCIIDPENVASLNVARKTAYNEVLRTTYHEKPTILLERPKAGGLNSV